MIRTYDKIFTDADINFLLNLPEVLTAKNAIDHKSAGSVYFSIPLTPSLRSTIHDTFSLDLANVDAIPMRWIKGDTTPHIDRGVRSFENTYLLYLTDSVGELRIDNNSYPISCGSGYMFNEGLQHETTGTGSEPRLLMGPMSEEGFAVGISINRPGGTTIYFRQISGVIAYSIDNQINWINVGNNFPISIINTDTAAGLLKVEFITDITLDDSSPGGIFKYLSCGSSDIQFGSTSLNPDGTRPKINIEDVNSYPGFIKNGDAGYNGQNTIYVFNLDIRSTGVGNTYLADDSGWIAQAYFGKGATNNYIVNCYSDGYIAENGGGIVGAYSGSESGAELTIIGCSSSGEISNYAGGIIGVYAGRNTGTVTCQQCWSTGANTNVNAGGIFGSSAGDSGITNAVNCYSTGSIGNGGGIYGSLAGNAGAAYATKCYSLGNIDTDAGGIFGGSSASDSGSTNASNCYSAGTVTTTGNGIYGTGKQSGATESNCYVADDSWNNIAANIALTGIPNPVIGTTWVFTGLNTPYELLDMGYTPYSTTNIFIAPNPALKRTYPSTLIQGSSTPVAIAPGKSYTILGIKQSGTFGEYPTITINATTGAISTTSETITGVYDIYIRNTGSYNITQYTLTVTAAGPIPCLTEETMVLTPGGYKNVKSLEKDDLVITSDNRSVRIVNIFKTLVAGTHQTYPYIIPKNSIALNYPRQDTRLSGGHLILRGGNEWICPALSRQFRQDTTDSIIKYYHIELEDYETDHLVINDGLVVESFTGFNNRRNHAINAFRVRKYGVNDANNRRLVAHYRNMQKQKQNVGGKMTVDQRVNRYLRVKK